MQNDSINVIDKIKESYLPAKYEADKMLQKIIHLVKTKEVAKISRLPAPGREKFNSFSIDSRNYLYMDERLVIPTNLRASNHELNPLLASWPGHYAPVRRGYLVAKNS